MSQKSPSTDRKQTMGSTTETIASTETARGKIALRERTDDDGTVVHELVVAGIFAMDTVDTSTETALAERSLERVASPARVLVGGLGLGFTAWQVLKDKRVRELHVVELEEDLVQWARLGLTPTLGVLARHPRVTLHVQDAASAVTGDGELVGPWDLVLLDVDSTPGTPVHEGDERTHSSAALSSLLSQVAKGGALVIWAAQREPALLSTMHALAPTQEVLLPVERQGRSLEYALYLARP